MNVNKINTKIVKCFGLICKYNPSNSLVSICIYHLWVTNFSHMSGSSHINKIKSKKRDIKGT